MAKVVVVDDNVDMRELMSTCVRMSGHEVETAEDGIQALATMRSGDHDLVVLDWMMPEMDGLEACTIVRSEPRLAAIPILLVTAAGRNNLEADARFSAADRVLHKPFSVADLMTAVEELLHTEHAS